MVGLCSFSHAAKTKRVEGDGEHGQWFRVVGSKYFSNHERERERERDGEAKQKPLSVCQRWCFFFFIIIIIIIINA